MNITRSEKAWRMALLACLPLILLLGSLLFILPSLAHKTSTHAYTMGPALRIYATAPVTRQNTLQENCHVVVASGMQPCVKRTYNWTLDETHPSPRLLVGPDWSLSYACDGGPGKLFINERFIQAMVCDNAWHSRTFGRGGFAQISVDRQVDVTVVG